MTCDVLVVGGGPAGSTAALASARAGLSVRLLEKASHPRFHVGESFLPQTLEQIASLGLEPAFDALTRTRKIGASMMFATDDAPMDFLFEDSLPGCGDEAFNIERAPFDAMLLDAARDAGVDVCEGVGVDGIESLDERGVVASTSDGPARARLLMDATGQATLVGRKLGTRRVVPGLEKVAYFTHLTGVPRRPAPLDGCPIFVMCSEGWFWLIPIDEGRTSVGAVLDAPVARRAGVPARRMLRWACGRCPAVWSLVRDSDMTAPNHVQADFSYTCKPYAGPGYVLVGDSAVFIDPVFSTGVCLGMMAGEHSARLAPRMIAGGRGAREAAGAYHAYVDRVSSFYMSLIRAFYTPAFRDLFMQGRGPWQVHRAMMSILAGDVFPSPSLAVRWRWRLFKILMHVHEQVGLVERRTPWSLLDASTANDEALLARQSVQV